MNVMLKRAIVLIIILTFFLLFSFIFVVVIVYFWSKSNNSEKCGTKNSDYRYFKLDSSTNKTSFGITSIPAMASNFVSYQNDEGGQILISRFDGSEEYHCTGSCYCKTSSRRAASVISSGLTYLLTATTAVLALNIAKEHFSKECKESFSNTECEEIHSELVTCENVIGMGRVLSRKERDAKKTKSQSKKGKNEVFHCMGTCIFPQWVKSDRIFMKAKEFGCENLMFEGDVTIAGSERDPFRKFIDMAELMFFQDYMTPYCKKNSRNKEFFKKLNDDRESEGKSTLLRNNLCDANKKSIKCRHTPPPPY